MLNSTETTTIDLLIGSDYFWEIVGGDKVVLPSGMFMLPSKFGFIVTGKCCVETDRKNDYPCALFVTTEFQEGASNYQVQCSANLSSVRIHPWKGSGILRLSELEIPGVLRVMMMMKQ